MWAFMFLKSYHNEEVAAGIAGVDEKTYRDKVWFYVKGIARLDSAVVRCVAAVFPLGFAECLLLSVSNYSCFSCRFNGTIDSLVAQVSGVSLQWTVLTFPFQSPHPGPPFGGRTSSMVPDFGMK